MPTEYKLDFIFSSLPLFHQPLVETFIIAFVRSEVISNAMLTLSPGRHQYSLTRLEESHRTFHELNDKVMIHTGQKPLLEWNLRWLGY